MKSSTIRTWIKVIRYGHLAFIVTILGSLGLALALVSSGLLDEGRLNVLARYMMRVTWVLCAGLLLLNLVYGGCPLTTLENRLVCRVDPEAKPKKSFIGDLARRWFGIDISSEFIVLGMIGLVVMATVLVILV